MQHEKYEINTDSVPTYSHGRHIGSDAIRGLVAGFRGVLESRRMKRDAKDAKEQRIADEAYRNRLADLEERKLSVEETYKTAMTDQAQQQVDIEKARQEAEQAKIDMEKAAQEAKDTLKTQYGNTYDEYMEAEQEYRDLVRQRGDEPNEELDAKIKTLRTELMKKGAWLKRNAKNAEFPDFTRYDKLLEDDEEAAEEAETQAAQGEQNQRTLAAIQDPEIIEDEEQRTRLQKLHEMNPDATLSELLALDKEIKEQPDNTENIRQEKMDIWNANKDSIIENYGDGVWKQIASDIKYSEDPASIDTNKYLKKPDSEKKEKDDNPHIKAGEHAYEAAIALGESPAIAEEKKREAIKQSIKEEMGEEAGTQMERVFDLVAQIQDPDLRKYIESSAVKTRSSRKVTSNLIAITNQALRGETEEAMENLADIWADDASQTDKTAKSRFQDALIFQNMRDKLQELKDMGIETRRVNQKYLDALSRGDFTSAAQAFGLEAVGADLSDEQSRKFAEVEAYIKNQFAVFLNRISGTAASDTERANLVAINPNLFMTEGVNIGIIDGNIKYLRDREKALFEDNSDPEFAAKVMASKGWDRVKTTDDTPEGRQAESDARLEAAARAAVDAEVSEDEFVEKVMPLWKDKDEAEIRKLYQAAVQAKAEKPEETEEE